MPHTTTNSTGPLAKPQNDFDAVIVGAGFAGMYMLYRLRGLGLRVRVYEAGDGVGGTWYWNRYPGARCDVESMEYSYSFSDALQQEWNWTERYATQPEILRYLNHVAERFDLYPDIRFKTRVTEAHFDDTTGRWEIRTNAGERVSAKFCIMATGCLSAPRTPDFKGLGEFKGSWYHTGNWPHEPVDFTGKRVGVIGTGSTGIQSIPVIAKQAAQVFVFQRTPNFSLPAANFPLKPESVQSFKENYASIRHTMRHSPSGISAEFNPGSALEVKSDERERVFATRWEAGGVAFVGSYGDLMTNLDANQTAADFVRGKIREIVKDTKVAEMLAPKDHPIGTKRICIDTGYYATYNRDNVTLVDVRRSPIEEITPIGLRTKDTEYELDAIVFATGFDAMTGALVNIDIRGRHNRPLSQKWAVGPRTYLGVATAGFPNLFMITGPGSPSVLSNMVVSIEQHVDWVTGCMKYMRKHGFDFIEPNVEAEDAWVAHVNEVANHTLYPQAASWYMGANVPGKPRIFMPYVGGVGAYRQKCDEVASKGYQGFALGEHVSAATLMST